MREPPLIRLLPDGRRVHLHDGPIDLILEAWGAPAAVRAAHRAAAARMNGLLDELCDELVILRAPAGGHVPVPAGPIARRMCAAVEPYAAECFITPMAAVAGAVAEAVLAAMVEAAPLDRAYVNNGGDIALHIEPGESLTAGLIDRPDRPSMIGTARLGAEDGIFGIATSGRHGRSFSLGIADAVTVLAARAADADAAATILANAVDLPGHPGILRVAADSIDPNTDLGSRLVTRAVVPLDPAERDRALAAGIARASGLIRAGRIVGASLHLQGATRTIGRLGSLPPPSPLPEETESFRRMPHA
ncbi:hypothetical protein GCM10011611_28660 [Aliidongia dinghuensis]|uniref:Uncharacterized protein n=1 Tax=Aliidongia dinghuensis TaxID=1867774 RepID=A0A8J3E5D1_9PROT|nr:UPF0280 family protein [Aliidongia dinghuensis]GGF20858.1 hypothetical protein GCM10011611_28660 [Aliidongia dinghuensis]